MEREIRDFRAMIERRGNSSCWKKNLHGQEKQVAFFYVTR